MSENKPLNMVDDESEFMEYGGNENNEFIVGGDEYVENPVYSEEVVTGGSGNLFMNCGIALLIVILILIFLKMIIHKQNSRQLRAHSPHSYKKHSDTFDNLLIPPSYFDYNAHGKQYINWTQNY